MKQLAGWILIIAMSGCSASSVRDVHFGPVGGDFKVRVEGSYCQRDAPVGLMDVEAMVPTGGLATPFNLEMIRGGVSLRSTMRVDSVSGSVEIEVINSANQNLPREFEYAEDKH